MRILHTADWHLGDRLGRQDRTADLQRAVERVAGYCEQHKVDVLLVAGDLFSEMSRADSLRDSIDHLRDTFLPFLSTGGTIVTLTGNHDNEVFCQTLRSTLRLAAPAEIRSDEVAAPGRLYLAVGPCLYRLANHEGPPVQFVLMPYPTPARYLNGEKSSYSSLEDKNRALQSAYTHKLRDILDQDHFNPMQPTVLSAHIHVEGGKLPSLFRMTENESIIFQASHLPPGLAYVALGHIHQPQRIGSVGHVRYSGSIERLDLGERDDSKSVTLLEIGPEGLRGEPILLPLPATPLYDVEIRKPREELPLLREKYPDAADALVRYRLVWTAGEDDREAILRELNSIFPRWYEREVVEARALQTQDRLGGASAASRSFADTVREYLKAELQASPEEESDAVLHLAEEFLVQEEEEKEV